MTHARDGGFAGFFADDSIACTFAVSSTLDITTGLEEGTSLGLLEWFWRSGGVVVLKMPTLR